MEETNRMTVTDDNGQEKEVEIVLTFENNGKNYVLFTDPADPEGAVYAYTYDEDGNLEAVNSDEELEQCQEILGAFQSDEDDDGE